MTSRPALTLLFLAALHLLIGCNSPGGDGSKVLAKVNGTPLTANDVAFRVREAHGKMPQIGEITIGDIIDQELLYQRGVLLGLDREPVYRNKLPDLAKKPAGAKRLELARLVFNSQIAAQVAVTNLEGEKYFRENRERIGRELHLEMIRFGKKSEADEALKKLAAGGDFEVLAASVMGSTPTKGRPPYDLGFVKWQEIPVDFTDHIYRLKPGEVSAPLGTQRTGYQIVKLKGVRNVPVPEYPKLAAAVMNRLRDQRVLAAYQQYLAQLKKEATIVTF